MDVEELTPLIEDLDLAESILMKRRLFAIEIYFKRVVDNRSTFIDIDIDIEQVRRQNLPLANEDIDNWTDSDSAQIVEIETCL